jgi:peptidoglycan/xylan/chitin deacetylase (PgdA/CDA1 family)
MTGAARRERRRWLAQMVVGLVALPLSVIPFWLYSAHTDSGYLAYLKVRYSVAPPATGALAPAVERAAAAARRASGAGVPVLVYHGVGRTPADTEERRFVLSRRRFAEQMLALRAAGYTAITTAQLAPYVRRGERRELPRKPVLITFDDGRFDALLQGDQILRDTGMRATMFVIGGAAESNSPYYEDWDGLQRRGRTGRWELQNHTHDLHHRRGGISALVHVARRETLRDYRSRVARDLDRADAELAKRGSRFRGAFAYPFGDWGSAAPLRVRRALRGVLASQFALAFDQDEQDRWRPSLPGDDPLHLHRLSVEDWSGAQLLARLERGARRARGHAGR